MRKIYTIGETTYDILFRNGQPSGAVVGGSVLNTSVSLGRIELPVSFISRIGNDHIGDLSMSFLQNNGVDCSYINRFEGNSRLALAFLDEENNADYQFYKAAKAPTLFFPEVNSDDIVSFGSTNALRDEGRNSLLLFLNQAHDKNVLTIYDPNIREFGAVELIDIRKKFEENLYLTKVLKGSNQDFQRLYETEDVNEIFNIVGDFGVETLIITSGVNPVVIKTTRFETSIEIDKVETKSTIGAGDNFTAGLVYGFYQNDIKTETISSISKAEWVRLIKCANLFAANVCMSESNYISSDFLKTCNCEKITTP